MSTHDLTLRALRAHALPGLVSLALLVVGLMGVLS